VERKWTKDYDKLVEDASGILLFVHPLKIVSPERIDPSLQDAVDILADEQDRAEDEAQVLDVNTLPEWRAEQAPTQVQLVELLQFVDGRFDRRMIPVAIIVSAWDLIANNYASAEEWLSQRLPLLHQYLRANSERFPSRAYGLSAQGAQLDGDLSRLQEYEHQSERIKVVGEGASSHDITAPTKWLMETVQRNAFS
jgi:hypothetical protein